MSRSGKTILWTLVTVAAVFLVAGTVAAVFWCN